MTSNGYVRMSTEFVLSALGFPDGTSIRGVRYDPFTECFDFAIAHSDLRDVPEGESIPLVILRWNNDTATYEFSGRGQ